MKERRNSPYTLVLALLGAAALVATAARAADRIRIVRVDPPRGDLATWTRGTPMTPANSIDVTYEYELDSVPSAFAFADFGGIGSAYAIPGRISRGHGRGHNRVTFQCLPRGPLVISGLTLRASMVRRNGDRTYLAQSDPMPVPISFHCPGAKLPAEKTAKIATPVPLEIHPVIVPKLVPEAAACPDPAAASLTARLLARATKFGQTQGTVEITGIVRNIASGPYTSSFGQQWAELWELVLGGKPKLLRRQNFTNLRPGQEVRVTYRRDWNTAIEFQPSFRLTIVYDPDITRDGNPANDDCNVGNNTKELAGSEINDVF